jgi:hypothetical protein
VVADVVARLCAQAAQCAIFIFCALCSPTPGVRGWSPPLSAGNHALLRLLVGPLADAQRMRYPKFLAANAFGGLSWRAAQPRSSISLCSSESRSRCCCGERAAPLIRDLDEAHTWDCLRTD